MRTPCARDPALRRRHGRSTRAAGDRFLRADRRLAASGRWRAAAPTSRCSTTRRSPTSATPTSRCGWSREHGVAAIPISPFLQPGEPAGPGAPVLLRQARRDAGARGRTLAARVGRVGQVGQVGQVGKTLIGSPRRCWLRRPAAQEKPLPDRQKFFEATRANLERVAEPAIGLCLHRAAARAAHEPVRTARQRHRDRGVPRWSRNRTAASRARWLRATASR